MTSARISTGTFRMNSVIHDGRPSAYSPSKLMPVKPPLTRLFGLYRPLIAMHWIATMTKMMRSVESSCFQLNFFCVLFCSIG